MNFKSLFKVYEGLKLKKPENFYTPSGVRCLKSANIHEKYFISYRLSIIYNNYRKGFKLRVMSYEL